MKIGVIDSGIGGLTVLKSLIEKHKNHEYIYFGDTIHLPYGDKTKEEIINYANTIIKNLEDIGCELIIIACGTISSNIEYVNSKVRLIDIISPLKDKLDKYEKVSIMATPLSIKTNAFKKYINTNINLIACQKLVPIIESFDYTNLDAILKEYLSSTTNSDALILGCTHYPLIKKHIEKYFHQEIITLDKYILDMMSNLPKSKYSLKIYYSKLTNELIKNTEKILDIDNLKIESWDINDRK